MSGQARAVVLCVGDHTIVQKESTVKEFNSESENTPLQDKLERFGSMLGGFAMAASGLCFILMTTYWFIYVGGGAESYMSWNAVLDLMNVFMTCLALLIVAVPEGMPLAISMALAFSFDKLTQDNVQIRKPEALETSGSLSNICTSMTSVLTKGELGIKDFHQGG